MSALLEDLFAKYLDPSLYRIVNGAIPETTHVRNLLVMQKNIPDIVYV